MWGETRYEHDRYAPTRRRAPCPAARPPPKQLGMGSEMRSSDRRVTYFNRIAVNCSTGKNDFLANALSKYIWLSSNAFHLRSRCESRCFALVPNLKFPNSSRLILVCYMYVQCVHSICSKGSVNAPPSLCPVPGRGGMPTSTLNERTLHVQLAIGIAVSTSNKGRRRAAAPEAAEGRPE